ncbi:MAG: GNAT family N-acetyltransferase [Candidatus Bathyarchaeia archaeon]
MTSPATNEAVRRLRKGLPMEKGPRDLRVRIDFFDLRRKDKGRGRFILEVPNEFKGINGKVEFGFAWFSIYYKQGIRHNFKIEAKSAVLWDIKIHQEEWRRKGIGFELLGFMKEVAKSRGAERFYAHYVKPESEGFFVKAGFAPTVDPIWWILKEF